MRTILIAIVASLPLCGCVALPDGSLAPVPPPGATIPPPAPAVVYAPPVYGDGYGAVAQPGVPIYVVPAPPPPPVISPSVGIGIGLGYGWGGGYWGRPYSRRW